MKRFLSILLCSVMLVTAVPGTYYAQGFDNVTAYSDDGSNLNNEIDFHPVALPHRSGHKEGRHFESMSHFASHWPNWRLFCWRNDEKLSRTRGQHRPPIHTSNAPAGCITVGHQSRYRLVSTATSCRGGMCLP